MTGKFELYRQILLRENEKYNLTAITEPEEIRQKHFEDSLSLLDDIEIPQGASLLDVGSGAGFPGVPLLIARPDLRVTLLDSTAKKAEFLRMVAEELELPLKVVCMRAEVAAHETGMRERYDVVVSRALASLPLLCELCLPFVKVGGVFAAYKGTREKALMELEAAREAIRILGAGEATIKGETTVYGERTRMILRKISQTPTKYPRNYGVILKKPL